MIIRGCEFPGDRYYHVDINVWMKEESPGVVLLGATSFGAALAVEFVAFLPKPSGTQVEAGRAVGLLELSKTMVSVRSPVKATILGHNAAAVADPSLISTDPYHGGWLLRLGVADWKSAELVSGAAIAAAFEQAMDQENFTGRQER